MDPEKLNQDRRQSRLWVGAYNLDQWYWALHTGTPYAYRLFTQTLTVETELPHSSEESPDDMHTR